MKKLITSILLLAMTHNLFASCLEDYTKRYDKLTKRVAKLRIGAYTIIGAPFVAIPLVIASSKRKGVWKAANLIELSYDMLNRRAGCLVPKSRKIVSRSSCDDLNKLLMNRKLRRRVRGRDWVAKQYNLARMLVIADKYMLLCKKKPLTYKKIKKLLKKGRLQEDVDDAILDHSNDRRWIPPVRYRRHRGGRSYDHGRHRRNGRSYDHGRHRHPTTPRWRYDW